MSDKLDVQDSSELEEILLDSGIGLVRNEDGLSALCDAFDMLELDHGIEVTTVEDEQEIQVIFHFKK